MSDTKVSEPSLVECVEKLLARGPWKAIKPDVFQCKSCQAVVLGRQLVTRDAHEIGCEWLAVEKAVERARLAEKEAECERLRNQLHGVSSEFIDELEKMGADARVIEAAKDMQVEAECGTSTIKADYYEKQIAMLRESLDACMDDLSKQTDKLTALHVRLAEKEAECEQHKTSLEILSADMGYANWKLRAECERLRGAYDDHRAIIREALPWVSSQSVPLECSSTIESLTKRMREVCGE
jgi:hypothetical protein